MALYSALLQARHFLPLPNFLSGSLESLLLWYRRLSELEGNLEIFQFKLVFIQMRKPKPGELNPGFVVFIPVNSVSSFSLLPLVNCFFFPSQESLSGFP